jgi:phosphohistidine phosphatase
MISLLNLVLRALPILLVSDSILVDGLGTEENAMILYLVRHGIAVPRGTPGIDDSSRALTNEGISKMKQIAAGLVRLEHVPEIILSSPLVRARQTTDILLQAFGKEVESEIFPALALEGARRELYRKIGSLGKKQIKRLMMVGHQPSLGEIAGEIAFGSSENFIELKKGGVCTMELESALGAPKGILVDLLTPAILRRLATSV